MINEINIDKIKQLKLPGFLDGLEYINQSQLLHTLSLSEGLALLIHRKKHYRDNKRLARLIKSAKLRYPNAMVEDINHEHKRAISIDQLKWFTSGQWLNNHKSILLIGPTGIGKKYLTLLALNLPAVLELKQDTTDYQNYWRHYGLLMLKEVIRNSLGSY